MSNLQRTWQRLRGRTCDTCAFADSFRSNGDGQVTRLQTFCRSPHSPYHDRPIPPERLCQSWQKADKPRRPPSVGDPNLTA